MVATARCLFWISMAYNQVLNTLVVRVVAAGHCQGRDHDQHDHNPTAINALTLKQMCIIFEGRVIYYIFICRNH